MKDVTIKKLENVPGVTIGVHQVFIKVFTQVIFIGSRPFLNSCKIVQSEDEIKSVIPHNNTDLMKKEMYRIIKQVIAEIDAAKE